MRIKEIYIDNFKTYDKLKFQCNDEFNFVVGENNIRKSTVLEAVQLWKCAYDRLIQNNGKSFYGSSTPCYLTFESLFFLRITSDKDIFKKSSKKKLSVTLTFSHEEVDYPLKITIEKPNIPNSYFRIKYDSISFNNFRDKIIDLGLNLRNTIFIYQTRPLFNSIKNEPFYNNAQLIKKISLGKSYEVIRNKILKSEKADIKFQELEEKLKNVFKTNFTIRSKNKNKQDDEHVRLTIQEEGKSEVEISLMGSGILQVLEIFSTLDFIKKHEHCVNILLIDEPDSHIHTNLQTSLIDELRKNTEYQIFLISHNDRLINKAEDGQLFYFNQKSIEQGVVRSLPIDSYSSVGVDLAKDLYSLEKSNSDKIIVLTEGKSDKKILESAWEKLNPDTEIPYLIIPTGREIDVEKRTGSADSVQQTLEFVSNLIDSLKIVGLFDNDQEGNNKFKGLKKNVFDNYSFENNSRKHLEKDIHGLLLPIPDGRELFVSNTEMQDRFLVIEHFFSNEILEQNNMIKSYVMNTEVSRIKDKKNDFSELINGLDSVHFSEFEKIFNAIDLLFIEEEVVIPI